MVLETKSLAELENLAAHLREQVQRNPDHSLMEQEALHDVEEWIEVRKKEARSISDEVA
jgi:hypothetical protein